MMAKVPTKPCKPFPTHIWSPNISHEGLTESAAEHIQLLSLEAQMTTADLPTQPTDTGSLWPLSNLNYSKQASELTKECQNYGRKGLSAN